MMVGSISGTLHLREDDDSSDWVASVSMDISRSTAVGTHSIELPTPNERSLLGSLFRRDLVDMENSSGGTPRRSLPRACFEPG